MASKEKNLSKLNFLNWILIIAIGLFLGLIVVYFSNIFDLDTTKKADWGTFGDFVGGTLNPIFALFSLFAIIYTIKIQTKELELSREELEATRKELEGSRIAQQEQSESLKLQNEATKLQMFENTFFQLLHQHNKYLDLLIEQKAINQINIRLFNYNQNDGSPEYACDINDVYLNFKEINQKNRVIKNYYMILFQLLKFLDEKSKNEIINIKQYSNIARALINDEILRLLAINCEAYSFGEYKEYIEKYAFFEHIYIDNKNIETETILNILSKYKKEAFGQNKNILEIINLLE